MQPNCRQGTIADSAWKAAQPSDSTWAQAVVVRRLRRLSQVKCEAALHVQFPSVLL